MSEWGDTAYLGLLPPAAWPPCLCSVGHWASGRLLGGTWPAAPLTLQTPQSCWGTGRAAGAEHGVVCSSLELAPLDTLPSCGMTLTLSSGWISGMESDSFIGLSLPGTSVVCSAVGGLIGVYGPWCYQKPSWSLWLVLTLEIMLLIWTAAYGNQVDVHDPFSDRKPRESPWSMLLLAAISKETCFVIISMTSDS